MTRADLIIELAAVEATRADRVQVVRIIIDEQGREIGRLRRGFFTVARDARNGELRSEAAE